MLSRTYFQKTTLVSLIQNKHSWFQRNEYYLWCWMCLNELVQKSTSLSPSGLWTCSHVAENGCHDRVCCGEPGLNSPETVVTQLIKEQLWYCAICCTIKWLHVRKSHESLQCMWGWDMICVYLCNTVLSRGLINWNKELIACGCGTLSFQWALWNAYRVFET